MQRHMALALALATVLPSQDRLPGRHREVAEDRLPRKHTPRRRSSMTVTTVTTTDTTMVATATTSTRMAAAMVPTMATLTRTVAPTTDGLLLRRSRGKVPKTTTVRRLRAGEACHLPEGGEDRGL